MAGSQVTAPNCGRNTLAVERRRVVVGVERLEPDLTRAVAGKHLPRETEATAVGTDDQPVVDEEPACREGVDIRCGQPTRCRLLGAVVDIEHRSAGVVAHDEPRAVRRLVEPRPRPGEVAVRGVKLRRRCGNPIEIPFDVEIADRALDAVVAVGQRIR